MFLHCVGDPQECTFASHFVSFFFWLPRFVAWPLELQLGSHNTRLVVWPLELGQRLTMHALLRGLSSWG